MIELSQHEFDEHPNENLKIFYGNKGSIDTESRFQISNKLYGRQKEIEVLTDAYQEASKGQFQLVLVKGSSGTGKTELINRTLKLLANEEGFFITGKFEQFQRDEPYIPFIQAFRNLMKQILTEPKEIVGKWRKKLIKALGRNGKVITQIIPEVELIIGEQVPIEAFDPQKTKRRFQRVLGKFIKIFAAEENPLVLFLDDMQWADSSSLQLLSDICSNSNKSHLLIIAAYRDDEVSNRHKLNEIVEEIKNNGSKVQSITLTHLNLYHTTSLIADTLSYPEEKVERLSELLYRKTIGNPFFLKQLLQLVYDEKLLDFNTKESCWEWNLDSIKKLEISDDVIKLVIKKLKKLPIETINILKLASCIGNTFDLSTLSIIYDKLCLQTGVDFWPLVEQGLVLPVESIEKTLKSDKYEFIHDRIHQGAYFLVPDDEKKEIHLRIARVILENTEQNEIEEKILNIMAHFNHGLNLIEKEEERIKLSKYNLMAGKKAKASAAYDSALKYFDCGIRLLPQDSWDKYYSLTYDLYFETAQCEYLCSHLEEAEGLFEIILANAKSNFENAEIYSLKMMLNSSVGNYSDGIKLGIKALGYLGIKLPENPGKLDLIKEVLLSKWIFRNKKGDDLLNLPESNNHNIKKALEILTLLAAPANFMNDDLFSLIILKLAILSAKYGNTEFSAIGYSGYAIVAASVLGDYVKGQEFEKVSLKLADKYNNNSTSCLVNFVNGTFVSHWTQHGKISIKYAENAFGYGLESGEFLYTGYAVTTILEMKHYLGVQLDEIYEDCLNYYDFTKKMKFKTALNLIAMCKQLIEVLKSTQQDPLTFMTDTFEKEMIESEKNEIMTYYLFKIQLYYLFGDYKNALNTSEKAMKNLESIIGYIFYAQHIFYNSLAITAVYDKLCEKEQKWYFKILKRNQHKMRKRSDDCPENFSHKYLLVNAEIARLKGNDKEAMILYDKAIKSAGENEYIQDEAIANELTAKYYLSTGGEKIAAVYINEAYQKYKCWGADRKTNSLKKQYKNMIKEVDIQESSDYPEVTGDIFSSSDNMEKYYIDKEKLDIIIKAFQSISEETDSERILVKFLETAIDTVGADRGYILFEEDDKLFIEAFKESWKHSVKGSNHIELEKYEDIPKGIIRYVARTFETVMLNDDEPTEIFSRDSYIIQSRPGSIVCLPLLIQDIFVGVIYLENNMTTEVFTPESVEILKVLSKQMVYVKKLQHFIEKDRAKNEDNTSKSLSEPLTERELEVLHLISSGMSNKEIAASLEVTVSTVKTHTMNIYGKLEVNRRVQAVTRAKELGILDEK